MTRNYLLLLPIHLNPRRGHQTGSGKPSAGGYVNETGSMTVILGQLKWESLNKRRKDNRLILLYKGLKGKARIPTDDLIPKTRRGTMGDRLANEIQRCQMSFNEGDPAPPRESNSI